MTLAAQEERTMTLADAIDRIGGVPLDRIRWRPAPGTAVEQDVVEINDHENRLFELADGILVEKPMGFLESTVAMKLGQLLGEFVERFDLGIVAGESGMVRIGMGLVRIPDVSVVLWNRLPERTVPREPIPNLVPNLAIEVLSASNTASEMDRKVAEYFNAGCQCVWLIDPVTASLRSFQSPSEFTTYSGDETVSGVPVLPGFQFTISDLLKRAGV